jgi:acyl carrier protein
MEKQELIKKLKDQIIDSLRLEDITPADINEEDELFGEGLGLDSIDALELIVILEKHYGIKLDDPDAGKTIFQTVGTIADFILENQK